MTITQAITVLENYHRWRVEGDALPVDLDAMLEAVEVAIKELRK